MTTECGGTGSGRASTLILFVRRAGASGSVHVRLGGASGPRMEHCTSVHWVELFPNISWGTQILGSLGGSAADGAVAALACPGLGGTRCGLALPRPDVDGTGTLSDLGAAPSCRDVDGADAFPRPSVDGVGAFSGLGAAPVCRDVDGAVACLAVDAAPPCWGVACFGV